MKDSLDLPFFASCMSYIWVRKVSQAVSPAAHWTPTSQFCDWLGKLVQRTQVSEAIQLLALNLVMRLTKKCTIQGMPGSEYRMILVALAISNKLLEDNTFTARTWSDVAGIDVEAINFGEREVLRALGWRIMPTASEWADWLVQMAAYRQKRHDALNAPVPIQLFDPSYSMVTPGYLTQNARSRSQPGSPLRVAVEHPIARRKRKADEVDGGFGLLEQPPATVARRSSAGQLQRQPPLFQTALQQGFLRSASLSPVALSTPFAISPASTPYSTPPAVFSPVTYSYLTQRLPSPAMPVNPQNVLYHTVLATDPATGRITTQLIAAPMQPYAASGSFYSYTPRSSLGGSPPPPYEPLRCAYDA